MGQLQHPLFASHQRTLTFPTPWTGPRGPCPQTRHPTTGPHQRQQSHYLPQPALTCHNGCATNTLTLRHLIRPLQMQSQSHPLHLHVSAPSHPQHSAAYLSALSTSISSERAMVAPLATMAETRPSGSFNPLGTTGPHGSSTSLVTLPPAHSVSVFASSKSCHTQCIKQFLLALLFLVDGTAIICPFLAPANSLRRPKSFLWKKSARGL
jgi:hypothetical protein